MRNSLTLTDVLNDLPDFSAMKLNEDNSNSNNSSNSNNNNNNESSSGKVFTPTPGTNAETIVPMIHNTNNHTHSKNAHEAVGLSSSGTEPEVEVEKEVEKEVEAEAEMTAQELPDDGQTETITESNNELIETERLFEVKILIFFTLH